MAEITRRNSALPGWELPPAPRRQMTSVDLTSSVEMYVSAIVVVDRVARVGIKSVGVSQSAVVCCAMKIEDVAKEA